MKIGIDGRFLEPQPSGNGVFSQMLITHLANHEARHRFVVYMNRNFDFIQQENLTLKRMHLLHRSPHLRFLFTFNRELRSNPVDVFHAIYTVPFNPPARVVLSLIEFFWITEPDIFPRSPLGRLQFTLMTRYGVRRADRVIVPTPYVRQRLLETMPIEEDKVQVVPLGVSGFFSERLSGREIESTLEKFSIFPPFILFVGNLQPRKNIERLIQCYDTIRGEGKTPLQLVVVGKRVWKFKPILDRISISPYRESIRWLDHVSLGDLRAIYQGARLFVFPSLEEGFGIPPLEAMASGVPVAASNRSSIPDVVGDAAIMFDPMDPADMKKAILEGLHNNTLRSEMAERGLQRVKGFSWDETAARTIRIYEELASS